jgi:membrane protein implicated in regulation of membrane protease activity
MVAPARETTMLVLGYIVLATLGAGYVLVSMLLGHVADFGSTHAGSAGATHSASEGYGVDHSGHGQATAGDGGPAGFQFPFFSPLALATFFAAVGGLGLIASFGFELRDAKSLLVALPGAFVITYLVTWAAWRLASGSRGTSTILPGQLAGVPAEILTPIPRDGVGEAAAQVAGQRFTAPAREVDGNEVPRGAAVTVVRLSGSTLVVKLSAR